MTGFDWRPVVDAVAEAICNTYHGDAEAWDTTYDRDAERWRRTAEAATTALKLIPEEVRLPYAETTMIIDGKVETLATIVATFPSDRGGITQITWEPGEEMPYAIEAIEDFLGPGTVDCLP